MALSQETFNAAYGPSSAWNAPAVGGMSFLKALQDAQAMKLARERQASEDAWRRQQYEQNREDKLAAIAEQRATREALQGQKKQEALDELAVPGYALTGQVRPAKGEAEKLRKAKGEMEALRQNISSYDEMVKKYGSAEFLGPESSQMASLATSIKMNLKNLYELGAITGPDLAILQSQAPSPQSMGALFTRNKTQQAGLKTLGDTLGTSFEKRMAASGYAPEQAGDPRVEMAKQALNDPEATPEEKAAAVRILGGK